MHPTRWPTQRNNHRDKYLIRDYAGIKYLPL